MTTKIYAGVGTMSPADLFAALSTANRPFQPFQLWLIGRSEPIIIRDQDGWCIAPSGRYVMCFKGNKLETYFASEISAVEYLD